jgi:hypothetical protein
MYDELQQIMKETPNVGWGTTTKIETVGQIEYVDPIPTPKMESNDKPF